MTNEEKAREISHDTMYVVATGKYSYTQSIVENMCLQIAQWKDEQWKEKTQTAFCYVHNCIGQCHNTVRPCELRQKFDDIMNGKWPKTEKLKQSNHVK